MADHEESSSFLPKTRNEKPVVVRVKRRAAQSIVEALWIEINERLSKKPSLDLEKLAITEPSAEGLEFKDFGKLVISESSGKEAVNTKKVLVRHVETIRYSKALYDVVQSLVRKDEANAKSRREEEALTKTARFEQILRSGKQTKGTWSEKVQLCRLYDVVRVDSEEMSTKPPEIEEFGASAAKEMIYDSFGYASGGVALQDEYVYDIYTVNDEMDDTDEALHPFPLVQLDDDEEFFYDAPSDSDYATNASKAEDNPSNDYPDEENDMSDSDFKKQRQEKTMNLNIRFNQEYRQVQISPYSNLQDLKSVIKSVTDVPAIAQLLIVSGTVLEDDSLILSCSDKIKNNSTIVLTSCPSPERESERLGQYLGLLLKHGRIAVKIGSKMVHLWMKTGIISLSDFNLTKIPDEVWEIGNSATLLDVSGNSISRIPREIRQLRHLKTLLLDENNIQDDNIMWEALVSLDLLTSLCLNANSLMVLPPALGELISLEELRVSSNRLTSIPMEIEHLTKLQILAVNNNRISSIPTSIGHCRFLIQIDLSENLIAELPEAICNLQNLKALHLKNNNSLRSIPCTIFKKCTQLTTLDLHNTNIKLDILRQFEGWEDFDEQQCLKHQKQY